ncbi:hypothetical protein FRB93_008810 [Tulasnella sp. JGI-2019a]|nr:hypothetical protein FRB93_008810 [Tulasnella sp. JGI-2019a]
MMMVTRHGTPSTSTPRVRSVEVQPPGHPIARVGPDDDVDPNLPTVLRRHLLSRNASVAQVLDPMTITVGLSGQQPAAERRQ